MSYFLVFKRYLLVLFYLNRFANCFELTIATYNIWNIMFNWEIRQLRIAQMVREADPDIIAFQEVRSSEGKDDVNQLTELNGILGQYEHRLFAAADRVIPPDKLYKRGWEREGIGLLSKHKIVHHTTKPLTYRDGPDKNRRVILHATIDTGHGTVNVVVVHFSYDKQQQCRNAAEIMNYITENRLRHVVVLGDFNIFKEFEWPLHVLTGENLGTKCPGSSHEAQPGYQMSDVWKTLNTGDPGLTFSNMPQPGMESRPDRILVSLDVKPLSAQRFGDGSVYKAKFFYHLVWNRIMLHMGAVRDANEGKQGKSCYHDCGPHASCRCGICVSGGDQNRCHSPNCGECNSTVTFHIQVFIVVFLVIIAQLLYSVLRVMYTIAMVRPGSNPEFLCFGKCCLCNTELYAPALGGIVNPSRQHKLLKIVTKAWPVLKLPPMGLFILTILVLGFYFEITYLYFDKAWKNIYAILPEELYPSDHLMLTAKLKIEP